MKQYQRKEFWTLVRRKIQCAIARLIVRMNDALKPLFEGLRDYHIKRFDASLKGAIKQIRYANQLTMLEKTASKRCEAYRNLREYLVMDNPNWIPIDDLGSGYDLRYSEITYLETI